MTLHSYIMSYMMHTNLKGHVYNSNTMPTAVAYPVFFSGCPETPPPAMICFNLP